MGDEFAIAFQRAITTIFAITVLVVAGDAKANGSIALVEYHDSVARADGTSLAGPVFPRLMGMNIARDVWQLPLYQSQLARLDIVMLGFYPGWNKAGGLIPIRDTVRAIKNRNPSAIIGQYTVLSEAQEDVPQHTQYRDKATKLDREQWWLRRADGAKVQWTTAYRAWETNITEWTRPDADGLRLPQWMARRDYRLFFGPVPEFGIWYFDNVMSHQRIKRADWDLDGKDDSGDDPRIQAAFRRGEAAEWEEARRLAPNVILMGNTDNDLSYPEYRNKLQGAFLEGLMGQSWSIERWGGWQKMMERYQNVFNNLLPPKIVGFNVSGRIDDYRFFRYAFTSCLMNNGYFSFTDKTKGYSSVPWFDEYDAKLGAAVDVPQTSPWRGEVYRRRFEKGVVFVNPTDHSQIVDVESGYRRIAGKQDPIVNDGHPVGSTIVVPARDGIVLIR